MPYDPVMSDLRAELRRDEQNEAITSAIRAATDEAEECVRQSILIACFSLPLSGWQHAAPGTFRKGDIALVSECDGWWSEHNGRRRGPYPDPHIALSVLES